MAAAGGLHSAMDRRLTLARAVSVPFEIASAHTTNPARIAAGIAATIACAFASSASAQLLPFNEQAVARGVTYIMPNIQSTGLFGAGCGFADLDNDGDQDIIILGGKIAVDGTQGVVGIFENNGNGFFTNRSLNNGIPVIAKASGFAAADYDGDGKIDLFITQMGAQNYLLRNNGNFQFQDRTVQANVFDVGPYMGVSWGDYNNDGWVDLHVCSYNGAIAGMQQNDKLYRNLGTGIFQEVSTLVGLTDTHGLAFQSQWFDYDRDGDVDLFISHDRGHFEQYPGNKLFRNDNGTFVDVSSSSGAGEELFSMGVACGDFDGNGWPDIYVTNLTGYEDGYNRLSLNQGDGTFVESSAEAGVQLWKTSWGSIFFDLDNDGHKDLYINNQYFPDTVFRHTGAFPCTDITAAVNLGGNTGKSFASAVGDIDNDGDLDVLVNHLGFNVQLFVNPHGGPGRRSLELKIAGVHPNYHAVGANVSTRIGSTWQYHEVYAGGNGYQGQNDLRVHVGTGTSFVADEVIVNWPGNSQTRTFTNMPTNLRWTIYSPDHLGDANRDGIVNYSDFYMFEDFYGIAVIPSCEVIDFNGDWHIDTADVDAFIKVFQGEPEDCNNNGIIDLYEILENLMLDMDQDGRIDVCEPPQIPGDIAPPGGNGIVNVDDLLVIINSWGPCANPPPGDCPADIAPPTQGDGVVNVDDLLMVINNWG